MATTANERKKMLSDLDGDWYRLDRMIPDDVERAQFVWDVAADGNFVDRYFCNTLANHYEPARTTIAVEFMGRAADAVEDHQRHRGIKGWDHSFEWLISRIADQDPKGLLAAKDKLPTMFQDFSSIFLAHRGALSGELPASAKRRLAIAWAATTWDEDWYAVREAVPAAEWSTLVLDSICAEDVVQVEWDRLKEFAGEATPAHAVAIISKDVGQHVRAHARQLLIDLQPADFGVVLAAIDAFDPEVNYRARAQRFALGEALIAAHGNAGMELPSALAELLNEALLDFDVLDPETTIAALHSVAVDERERLIVDALISSEYGVPRVIVTAPAAPTPRVLGALIGRTERCTSESDDVVTALAAFGPMAARPLLEALGAKDVSTPVTVMFIRALDQIGAPEAAETLVEFTGASTKGIRVAASQALENLGAAAIDALTVGADAKKKAIRETCAALLAQIEMAGTNPLTEIEKRATKLADPAMLAVLDELRTANSHSSDDHKKLTAFAETNGISVAVHVRDWFLEKPEDWHRSSIWRGVVEYFGDQPEIVWLATDAFAKLPAKMYSYHVKERARDLDRVAKAHAEVAGRALVFYLNGSPPEYRAEMLETLLAVAPKADVDVYIAAMQDSSKVVRELGIQGVALFGESQVATIAELLGSKKKDIRLAAADALTRIPATAVRAQLEAALASEKTAEVRTLLEQAVAGAGGSAFEFPGDDGREVADADIDTFLTGLNQPKLPSFVDASSLTLTYAHSRKALGVDALTALIGRLMKEDPDHEDEIARRVRPFLDDESANTFSVALKDAWAAAGGVAKEKWAIYQQAVMASEARLDEVAPQLDEMAAWSNHHLAKWYIEVLYRHGSRGAHSWLAYWAKNGERSSVVDTAQEFLARAAQTAGKETEVYATSLNSYIADDVADRAVPRLGLDAPLVVDYGERTFDVFMDPNHNLVIRDAETMKVAKSLPKPRANESLDPAVKAHVTDLKKSLRSVEKEVSKRLEASMVSGRPWLIEAFIELFGGHPIMSPFAGRLVFRAEDGTLFRMSDNDILTADYDQVTLSQGQTVRLAHPLQMSADELDVWGEHFADAEILQPFEQLGRPTFDLSDEIVLGKTTRGAVAGRLRRLGWRKGWAEDAGMVYTASRLLAGRGVRAWVEHGGFYVGDPSWDADEEIDVTRVWFDDLEGVELAKEAVDRLAYSEIALEVSQLLA